MCEVKVEVEQNVLCIIGDLLRATGIRPQASGCLFTILSQSGIPVIFHIKENRNYHCCKK